MDDTDVLVIIDYTERFAECQISLAWFSIMINSCHCATISQEIRSELVERYKPIREGDKKCKEYLKTFNTTRLNGNLYIYPTDSNIDQVNEYIELSEYIFENMPSLKQELDIYSQPISEAPDRLKTSECPICSRDIWSGVVQCHIHESHYWCIVCAFNHASVQTSQVCRNTTCPSCRTGINGRYSVYTVSDE